MPQPQIRLQYPSQFRLSEVAINHGMRIWHDLIFSVGAQSFDLTLLVRNLAFFRPQDIENRGNGKELWPLQMECDDALPSRKCPAATGNAPHTLFSGIVICFKARALILHDIWHARKYMVLLKLTPGNTVDWITPAFLD
ncbi:hypothetical protein NW762_001369 [Fusarium torreyae]|uniref:Uncharacterized protein n=1 Tax=Fusarium torreyae TaxID=1237075 RepID=A0A9W8SEL4_9HYPO|nr:hypothetical protein NW762_001369 [Fusarium torreyae]